MITFKSVGHFFANAIQKLLANAPAIEASATTVEAVTALVPTYGPLGATVEKAGYALLGEVLAVIKAGGAAAEEKFADLGLDANVIATVKAVGSDPAIVGAAKLI